MFSVDEAFVDAAAPNAGALAKGRQLVRSGKLVACFRDANDTLLFGECRGSGKKNYRPSADFQNPANPVYRCTCPSRQFPCKHTVALLYAFALGEDFGIAEVPEDIAEKRAKQAVRAENRKERASKPKKVNKKALAKKIDAQLDGLSTLETMIHDLMRSGLGALNLKTARALEEQAKQLGDAFLPGAQSALRELTLLFSDEPVSSSAAERTREQIYTEAIERVTRLDVLCRRGRSYLEARKADESLSADTSTSIAAWLGHAWQLAELKQHGLVEENAELVQLYFRSYDDKARRERVDLGVWLNLKSGELARTLNYRPYRAERFLKEDGCFFHVRQTPALYRYPGAAMPRIRWDEANQRALGSDDLSTVRTHALGLGAAIKKVKGQLKEPLRTHSYALVHYDAIGRIGDELVLEHEGVRIALRDDADWEPFETSELIELVDPALHTRQVALLVFLPDRDEHALRAKPLTLVSADQVVRLAL